MRLASEKFKYLEEAKRLLPAGSVPAFQKVSDLSEIKLSASHILRSSLASESGDQLLSGKSLSIASIDTKQKLDEAWTKIHAQPELEEVLWQQEIFWDKHLTVVVEKNFVFFEARNRNGKKEFFYWSELVKSLEPIVQSLVNFLSPLRPLIQDGQPWLLELGSVSDKFFVFQLHPVRSALLEKIFSTELVSQIISSRLRFAKKQTLFHLLATEWKARQFRQQASSAFSAAQVFLNWEYLFHYFRLFCMLNHKQPDAQSFADFLSESFKKGWLGSMVKKHLELANFFRQNEPFDPMKLGFGSSGPVFIGKGVLEGVVGEDLIFCEEVDLAAIYHKQKPRAILTKEVGMLSHPVLASVENGIPLVLGLCQDLEVGDRIYLDFERRELRVN